MFDGSLIAENESAVRTHLGKMSTIDHAVLELSFNYFFKMAEKLHDAIID